MTRLHSETGIQHLSFTMPTLNTRKVAFNFITAIMSIINVRKIYKHDFHVYINTIILGQAKK